MEALPRSPRLGTYPPDIDNSGPDDANNGHDDENAPRLDLSVRLDRPFHELKEFLLAEFERAYVMRCLTESAMNVSMASRASGLSRKHLRTLMSKYGIRRSDFGREDEPDVSDPNEPSS